MPSQFIHPARRLRFARYKSHNRLHRRSNNFWATIRSGRQVGRLPPATNHLSLIRDFAYRSL
jgi:hypothetical protein